MFEPREHLLAVSELRQRFITTNLSELMFEPNSYVSFCASSFVNAISLIKIEVFEEPEIENATGRRPRAFVGTPC